MIVPHVCPKYNGERVVENYPSGMSAGHESHRTCPTCGGEGVVWDQQEPVVINFEVANIKFGLAPEMPDVSGFGCDRIEGMN